MIDVQTVIAGNRQAVTAFLTAARAVPASRWTEAPTPGKWSPAEITEHVALGYEVSRGILHGSYSGLTLPQFLRPLIRGFFLRPVLQRGRFGKGTKAPKFLRPTGSYTALEQVTARLQTAADSFESYIAVAARAGKTTVNHPVFGRLPITELVQLQTIHTQHHQQQLSPTTS